MTWRIEHGECLERMRAMPDASVDAVVTDPPYGLSREPDPVEVLTHWLAGDDYQHRGLGFMGATWDSFVPGPSVWREALRVLKPGGHLVAFFGTRTYDLGALAVRLAGFEIRDQLAWMFGSGFPKSLDVSKSIDKRRDWAALKELQGAVREARGRLGITQSEAARRVGLIGPTESLGGGGFMWFETGMRVPTREQWPRLKAALELGDDYDDAFAAAEREHLGEYQEDRMPGGFGDHRFSAVDREITTPLSENGLRWQGWGTALKPAYEPIVLARKPLIGTVAATVLAHGTGALNIDGCRVGFASDEDERESKAKNRHADFGSGARDNAVFGADNRARGEHGNYDPVGRWPANVLLDEDAAAILDTQTGHLHDPGNIGGTPRNGMGYHGSHAMQAMPEGYGDSGGASRFFYVAKASTAERNAGLDAFPLRDRPAWSSGTQNAGAFQEGETGPTRNVHPTVKPIEVMRWLIRLVTPPGGLVLDMYVGSGTTGCAAVLEGFEFVGIEREAEFVEIGRARLGFWSRYPPGTKTAAILTELGDGRRAGEQREAQRVDRAGGGQLDILSAIAETETAA